jgi:hypothetical protein
MTETARFDTTSADTTHGERPMTAAGITDDSNSKPSNRRHRTGAKAVSRLQCVVCKASVLLPDSLLPAPTKVWDHVLLKCPVCRVDDAAMKVIDRRVTVKSQAKDDIPF